MNLQRWIIEKLWPRFETNMFPLQATTWYQVTKPWNSSKDLRKIAFDKGIYTNKRVMGEIRWPKNNVNKHYPELT